MARKRKRKRATDLSGFLSLLDEEGRATLPQFHVQVNWLSIDFNVHLGNNI